MVYTTAITPEVLGASMVRAAVFNAAKIKDRGDCVDANCWWRGGDDLNLRIFPARGTWKDIKLDDGGGARSFAERMGLSLREFLDRYGSLPDSFVQALRQHVAQKTRATDDRNAWWNPGDAAKCWESHAANTPAERMTKMRQWLWQRRGIPATARIPSGIAPADAQHVPGLEARLWVDGILERGPAVMAPLRSLGGADDENGLVTGLVLRPAKPTSPKFKTLNMKGIRSMPGAAPRVFGLLEGRGIEHIIICEGAPDTWTAEALVAELGVPALVIGANGAGQLPAIAEAMRSWAGMHVCVVFQLDGEKSQQIGQGKAMEAAATLRASGVRCNLFRWGSLFRALNDQGVRGRPVKDLSDVAQVCARSGVPWKTFAQHVHEFSRSDSVSTQPSAAASAASNGTGFPVFDDDTEEKKLVVMGKYKDAQLRATGPRGAEPSGPSPEDVDGFACEHTYGPDIIDIDSRRELVPVADLPNGHGWGGEVQQLLSGGLGPGDVITLGAGRAGAGKTAFLLQLSDGLAMRCAELAMNEDLDPAQPLTPVLIMSELDKNDLAKRTVARLCRFPVNVLRSAPAAIRHYGRIFRDENEARRSVDAAYQMDRDITSNSGWFHAMRPWLHVARPEASLAAIDVMEAYIERWRDRIAKAHPRRSIQPILVIDPVQRWQPEGMSEVEALNVLSERIDRLADRHGWSVLMTSDTNKEQAKAGAEEAVSSAAAFRGSYKLVHSSETTMVLRPDDPAPPKNAPKGFRFRRAAIEPWGERPRAITLTIDKNRNGPSWGEASFMWRPACGLFTAEVPEETEERRRSDQESARSQAAQFGDSSPKPRQRAEEQAGDDPSKRDAILNCLEDVAVSSRRGGREPIPQSGNTIISVVHGKRDAVQRELRLLESEGIISSVKTGSRLIGYVARPYDGSRGE